MLRTGLTLLAGAGAGAVLGLLVGGLWLNLQLGHNPNQGDLFVLLWDFPGAGLAFGTPPWKTAYGIVGASTLLFAIFTGALSFQQKLTEYGQARFQKRAEMKKNGLLRPLRAGLVFGKLGTPKSRKPFVSAGFTKFPHCMLVAPTRAGKGVGYVIPNTLLFAGSCVVLDVKGEIFEATSRHRQSQGDAIFRFAPFDFEHATHRYNPLERVARIEHPDRRYTELAKIADYFLTTSGKGTAQDFLNEGRELFVAAGLLAMERGRATIGEICRIIFAKGATAEHFGKLAEEVQSRPARQTFMKFSGYSDRTLSSHASVLGGAGLNLWNNPAVDRATSGNDFSFADLRKTPQSIYVVVNADDILTLAPLVRLFFGELIATLRATLPDPEREPWPVMIMLDEFDQLGRMPIVEQALKQLAGHGARVSIITQSIPGLDKVYEDENIRLSLESAAGMKLYLAANDKKTASEVSEALGKTTKLQVSDSLSRDRDFTRRRSVSRRMEERPLLTPDEVRRLSPDKALLIPERQNPCIVDRVVYYEDPTFLSLYEAQAGPLPYPDAATVGVRSMADQMAAMRDQLARQEEELRQLRKVRYGEFGRDRSKAGVAKAVAEEALAEDQPNGSGESAETTGIEALKPLGQDIEARISAFEAKLAGR